MNHKPVATRKMVKTIGEYTMEVVAISCENCGTFFGWTSPDDERHDDFIINNINYWADSLRGSLYEPCLGPQYSTLDKT